MTFILAQGFTLEDVKDTSDPSRINRSRVTRLAAWLSGLA